VGRESTPYARAPAVSFEELEETLPGHRLSQAAQKERIRRPPDELGPSPLQVTLQPPLRRVSLSPNCPCSNRSLTIGGASYEPTVAGTVKRITRRVVWEKVARNSSMVFEAAARLKAGSVAASRRPPRDRWAGGECGNSA